MKATVCWKRAVQDACCKLSVNYTVPVYPDHHMSTTIPDGRLKNNISNSKQTYIGNSIPLDNKDRNILDNDFVSNKKIVRMDDDDNNSLGSHKNRKLKSESGSHKGSSETLDDGEEKRDASKEDLEDGMLLDGTPTRTSFCLLCFTWFLVVKSSIGLRTEEVAAHTCCPHLLNTLAAPCLAAMQR